MTRRILATAVAVLAVAGAALLAVVPAATAQTGSGIGGCPAGSQDVGNVTVGQVFVLQVAPICVFNAGAPVTVTVNGVNIPGKVANATGQVLLTITAVSATQLSVDDPVITPAICGVNTVTVTGPSSAAASGVTTQTATFNLGCTTTPTTVGPVTVVSIAVPVSGGSVLSRTGANSVGYAAFALALVALGSVAVIGTRRRRAARL